MLPATLTLNGRQLVHPDVVAAAADLRLQPLPEHCAVRQVSLRHWPNAACVVLSAES